MHIFPRGSGSLEKRHSCTTQNQTQRSRSTCNNRRLCTHAMFCSHLLALLIGDLSQVDQIHLVCHQHHGKGLPAHETESSHQADSSRTRKISHTFPVSCHLLTTSEPSDKLKSQQSRVKNRHRVFCSGSYFRSLFTKCAAERV